MEARIADVLDEGDRIDDELARAISQATGVPVMKPPRSLAELLLPGLTSDTPLRPGQVRNLGPVAGTNGTRIPGIGAADLGEVVETPDGHLVAVFGDSFTGDKVGADPHYPSVAVPVTFDAKGHPHFGPPLTGAEHSNNPLFIPPPQAAGTDTLPAGSIRMRDGTTYMMVAGTTDLNPAGGSWLTKVTNDPAAGWKPINGSWRPWTPNAQPSPTNPHPGTAENSQPTQISGFQAADGNVYITADSFDRSQGVTMYRVDPDHVTDRNAWQPWTGNGWGKPGDVATTPVSGQQTFGELSFREVDGKPVLSGFNSTPGVNQVEVRVADNPQGIFSGSTPTVVAHNDSGNTPVSVQQPYGGYIMPNSTLNDLNLFVSQWNTKLNTPYDVQQVHVNPAH